MPSFFKLNDMRNILLIFVVIITVITSCKQNNTIREDYVGTFITENGTKFTLRADSTANIIFSDSLTYDATWKSVVSSDNWKFANIEFAGYQRYFYLHDGKLYRSEREMRHNVHGEKVNYQD